jgi:prevent-host-death family protein
MIIASLADVKTHLSAYIDQCITEGPIIITRNGKPAVVLVAPTDNEDLENLVLVRSPRFQAMLEKSRRSIEEGKGLSEEEFWSTVEQHNASSGQ